MARMYARKKGKSGSKKPAIPATDWISYNKNEIEKLIIKLSKEGNQTAKIGLILRDVYGIPLVKPIIGKTISQVLKENKIYPEYPEDLLNLMKKAVRLREHLTENKRDAHSKRGLELTESKVRRLTKYYKSKKILPNDWKYDPERAKLIIQKMK